MNTKTSLISRLVLSGALFLTGCSSSQKQGKETQKATSEATAEKNATKSTVTSLPRKELTQAMAQKRASLVKDVSYDLNLDLESAADTFQGKVTIRFKMDKVGDIFLDSTARQIESFVVNGKLVQSPSYDRPFLKIPENFLVVGENSIEVLYLGEYSRNGTGLYKFVDPEDKQTYLYTQFEPYDAHKLLPCFDQPDLKAEFRLTLDAPKEWIITTATLPTKEENLKTSKRWTFAPSKKMSTYAFSLTAGPFHVWSSKAGRIPLRLLVRKALAKYIQPEEWFTITRQGFSFYEKYFKTPYPFEKYDQVICPDFNFGAMENVGNVTFSERFVYRGQRTEAEREDLANVILHEMAHMWFGNLVTMVWWDDLWLNESFASIMAVISSAEATQYKKAWRTFLTSDKRWGYKEDASVGTHPIEALVSNTGDAFSNFDGITYGKGASVLKQLIYVLGEKNFKAGLQEYFKKFAFANATRADFLKTLSASSGKNLEPWAQEWLRTSGTNTLLPKFECEKGKITNFQILQTAGQLGVPPRSHRFKIAFLKNSNGLLKTAFVQDVSVESEVAAVPALVGKACPDFVHLNQDDHGYFRGSLDGKSLKLALTSINGIQDPFQRTMVWQTLWSMVLSHELSLVDYAEAVLSHLDKEKDQKVLELVTLTLLGDRRGSSSVVNYWPKDTPEAQKTYASFIARLEAFLWRKFEAAAASSDGKKLWWDSYVKIGQTTVAQNQFLSALQGKKGWSGIEIDQDRRWALISKLVRLRNAQAQSLFEAESKVDPSEIGEKAKLEIQASTPDAKAKVQWINKINELGSAGQQKALQQGLFPFEQVPLLDQSLEEVLSFFRKSLRTKDDEFLSHFAENILEGKYSPTIQKGLKKFYIKEKPFSASVDRILRIEIEEQDRAARLQSSVISSERRAIGD